MGWMEKGGIGRDREKERERERERSRIKGIIYRFMETGGYEGRDDDGARLR